MKRFFLFTVIVAGLALVSCKKDYTCDCTSSGGNAVTYDNLSKDSAAEFKTSCESSGCNWSQS